MQGKQWVLNILHNPMWAPQKRNQNKRLTFRDKSIFLLPTLPSLHQIPQLQKRTPGRWLQPPNWKGTLPNNVKKGEVENCSVNRVALPLTICWTHKYGWWDHGLLEYSESSNQNSYPSQKLLESYCLRAHISNCLELDLVYSTNILTLLSRQKPRILLYTTDWGNSYYLATNN